VCRFEPVPETGQSRAAVDEVRRALGRSDELRHILRISGVIAFGGVCVAPAIGRKLVRNATYVLIHGGGDSGWYWHLVEGELRQRSHDTVAMDLPVDDDSAGLSEYTDVVIEAIGDRKDVVVVAQSFGGYVAPIVCDRLPARLLVLVAGMVPSPGESAEEMFANTGYDREEHGKPTDVVGTFYQDVDPTLLAEVLAKGGRKQSETPSKEPWPLPAWPDVQTRYLLCRQDRLFPAAWVRRVVRDRLGIVPDEMDSGHTPALSHPEELVERLETYRAGLWETAQRRQPPAALAQGRQERLGVRDGKRA
jgi:pimeloyl-ACP methyl ester carboxylesterase